MAHSFQNSLIRESGVSLLIPFPNIHPHCNPCFYSRVRCFPLFTTLARSHELCRYHWQTLHVLVAGSGRKSVAELFPSVVAAWGKRMLPLNIWASSNVETEIAPHAFTLTSLRRKAFLLLLVLKTRRPLRMESLAPSRRMLSL